MTHWYPLAEIDDGFFETARFRFTPTVHAPASTSVVWETFSADDALVSWSRLITEAKWTSPRPFGVGTTRTVTIGHGAIALRERFYRWDEGTRMTFAAEAASRPGFRRFAEDIHLAPAVGGTRLTWTFVFDAEPWFTPLLQASRPALRWVTHGWAGGVVQRVHPTARDA